MTNTEEKKWFVVITKPRAEKRVGQRLMERGFETLVPVQRQRRQWHDRKRWVDVPLFNSYIFVKIEEKQRPSVLEVMGVVRYLSIGGQAAVLRPKEIEWIERLCGFEGSVEISDSSFEVGEEVEVIIGHLMGLRGVLTSAANKLKIHFPDLNCFASVEIERQYCRKIES